MSKRPETRPHPDRVRPEKLLLPPALRKPMPPAYEPMLLTLVDAPFDDPNWIFEPKFDGLRVLVRFDGRSVQLISRNGKDQSLQFPEIVEAVRESLDRPTVLDGEIVCLDEHGRSTFRKLQQRFHVLDREEIRRRAREYPAYLYVFDILYWNGYELTSLPLERRKEILNQVVRWSDRVRPTPATREHGTRMLRRACRNHEEGIVAKRVDSPYIGGRSGDWLKIKCSGRQEFVIGGWTDPQRSRVGLGALLVGYYTDDGKRLTYAGKVGTGFTRQMLLDLRRRLEGLRRSDSPFHGNGDLPHGPNVHWVDPRLVAEIAFSEWTQNGRLRQPRFEGLRVDKNPAGVRRERASSSYKAIRK